MNIPAINPYTQSHYTTEPGLVKPGSTEQSPSANFFESLDGDTVEISPQATETQQTTDSEPEEEIPLPPGSPKPPPN